MSEVESLISNALSINEKDLIRKVMHGVWEVSSPKENIKYEVTSYIDEEGLVRFSCGCPSFKFSKKDEVEKICKHCIAVMMFSNGFVPSFRVDEIITIADKGHDYAYRYVNGNTIANFLGKVYKLA